MQEIEFLEPSKMKKIRVGTIGTNFIVEWFVKAAAKCEGITWAAAYSRDIKKGEAFAGKATDVRIYDSLEMLAVSDEVDAVYVASPTSCHAKQAIMMLLAGKHVLCEKPIASNYQEWKAMQAAAKTSGTVLLEAMRPLFTPGYQAILKSLHKIGTVRRAEFSFCKYSSRYDDFKNDIIENAFRPEFSNGALMDIGVYCVETMVGILGAPETLQAKSVMLPNSIDGTGTILAGYKEALATVGYSKISTSDRGCEIQGEKGTITYEGITAPSNVQIIYNDGSVESLFKQLEIFDMVYEVQAFVDMIQGKESVEKYHAITTESMRIMDKVRASCGIVFPADKEGANVLRGICKKE